MQKNISIRERMLTYTLRTSRRARRVRLVVSCDGTVVVTMPWGFGETVVEHFLRSKALWLFSKVDFFKQFQGRVMLSESKREYKKEKERAYTLALERVAHFNTRYQFQFNRITIRNQKTRWGSCSKKGNLSFNYKIALLPERLADYIIVHELCHLGAFDHSARFWNLVAQTIPDHTERRRELRRIMLLQR